MTTLCFEQKPLKKGTWTAEEDQRLIAYINRYGIWNWNEMPKAAGLLRSGKSCRLRWVNYLKPDLKRGNFTNEEDELIISLHQKLGNRWAAIAAKLPGRTDNEIKNRWHSHLKKRRAEKTYSENDDLNSFKSPNVLNSVEFNNNIHPASSSESSPSSFSLLNYLDYESDHHHVQDIEHSFASSEQLHVDNQNGLEEQSLSIEDMELMMHQMWLDEEHTNYGYVSPGLASNSSSDPLYPCHCQGIHPIVEESVKLSELSGDQFQSSPLGAFNTLEDNHAYQMSLQGSICSSGSQFETADDLFSYPALLCDHNHQAAEVNMTGSTKELPSFWEQQSLSPLMESWEATGDYGLFRGLWQ